KTGSRTMNQIGSAMPGTERSFFMSARKWFFGVVAAVLTTAGSLSSPARAADPAADSNGPGKPHPVAAGGGRVQAKSIQPRQTADADAKSLVSLLSDPKVLGVSPDRAKLLTSADATRDSIVKAIETAVDSTTKDDLIILAFFGRGSSVAEKPAFFTPEVV